MWIDNKSAVYILRREPAKLMVQTTDMMNGDTLYDLISSDPQDLFELARGEAVLKEITPFGPHVVFVARVPEIPAGMLVRFLAEDIPNIRVGPNHVAHPAKRPF